MGFIFRAIKAIAYFYATMVLAVLLLIGIASALEPFGQFVMVGGLVLVMYLGPELIAEWRPQVSSPQHEPGSALPDPVPSPPAVQAPAHETAAREVYRGRLTTLPPG